MLIEPIMEKFKKWIFKAMVIAFVMKASSPLGKNYILFQIKITPNQRHSTAMCPTWDD